MLMKGFAEPFRANNTQKVNYSSRNAIYLEFAFTFCVYCVHYQILGRCDWASISLNTVNWTLCRRVADK